MVGRLRKSTGRKRLSMLESKKLSRKDSCINAGRWTVRRRERMRPSLIGAALAGLLLTVAACGGGSTSQNTKAIAGGTVVERLGGDYTGFNLLSAVLNPPGTLAVSAFYDRLVSYDAK